MVPPDDFIPAAEATSDLIRDLGRWALNQATMQLANWSRAGLDAEQPLVMAVNASGRHVNTAAIISDVESALAKSESPRIVLRWNSPKPHFRRQRFAATHTSPPSAPSACTSPSTTSAPATPPSGNSPQLPVDTLKIDRSFVASTNPRQRGLVTLMIAAAHAFDLDVVAEGIEDDEVLQSLRTPKCARHRTGLLLRPTDARPEHPRVGRSSGSPHNKFLRRISHRVNYCAWDCGSNGVSGPRIEPALRRCTRDPPGHRQTQEKAQLPRKGLVSASSPPVGTLGRLVLTAPGAVGRPTDSGP